MLSARTLCAAAALSLAAACGGEDTPLTDDPVVEGAEGVLVPASAVPEDDALVAEAEGAGAWRLDRDASTIMFTGTEEDSEFTGRFNRFDAAITLDPADLSSASIEAAIDLSSVDAGSNERNQSLPEADWFDTARHPVARFESDDIRRTDSGYEAVGTLSIKGTERTATLPFTLDITGDRAVADGSLTIDRTTFSIGQGDFAGPESVGIEVEVAIHIEADRI